MAENRIEAYPLKVRELATVDICAGKSITDYIVDMLSANSLILEDGDILVIVSKLVSIFDGRVIRTSEVKPSLRARLIGKAFSKDPKKVELILGEGRVQSVVPIEQISKIPSLWARFLSFYNDPKVLADDIKDRGATLMVKTNGVLLDNAGIDVSNVPAGYVALLPIDADYSANQICRSVRQVTGKEIAIIITDTATVLGKIGTQDVALGCAGLDPIDRNLVDDDVFGKPDGGSMELVADSLAALGGLSMGQGDEATPICLIRGFAYKPEKEEGGMKVVAYPHGVLLRSALLIVLATIFYYILYILTLPFGSRKRTNQRNQHQDKNEVN